MTLVTPSQSNPNDEIRSASINGPINQIAAVVNGNIDDTNISSVSGAKLADGTVTFAKTNGKLWWEELGRTTLTTTATSISVQGLPARKHLHIIIVGIASGTVDYTNLRFNNDATAAYSSSTVFNNSGSPAYQDLSSQSSLAVEASQIPSGGSTHAELFVSNYASTNKLITGTSASDITSTAASTRSTGRSISGKWVNAGQITRVDFLAGTNNFAAGSEVVVLGHD